MYERIVFDIENNGFLHDTDTIHCIVMQDLKTGKVGKFYDAFIDGRISDGSVRDGVRILSNAALISGHNISGHDVPVLERLFPEDFQPSEKQVQLDTIVISRLLYPERWQHTIESWAKTLRLSVQKVKNEQWEKLTNNMLVRCIADVQINKSILMHFQEVIRDHERGGTNWIPAIQCEQKVNKIHAYQVDHGVWYNQELAKKTLTVFDKELAELKELITLNAPLHLESPGLTKPKRQSILDGILPLYEGVKKPLRKDGTLAIVPAKYFAETDHPVETIKGAYCKVEFVPMNVDSDEQVKEFLYSLGWTPDEWNMKRLDDGSVIRNSPKLSESSFGSLPPGLGQVIKNYRTLRHRRGLIQSPKSDKKGALAQVRADGRVPAMAITCGTPTQRYRHSGAVCNIPRPSSPYGSEVRALYGVDPTDDNRWQVGIDLSGIEARMLAHFCHPYPGGPEFGELVTEGDWHSENAKLWRCERNDAKTELYALMYNAGPQKLGNILGRSKKEGAKNKADFMRKYSPYAELVRDLERELEQNDGYIMGLDGRRLYVRNKKDVLNTCLQANATIIFKYWMIRMAEIRANAPSEIHQMIAYHDETQNEVIGPKSHAETFGALAESAAKDIGEEFDINVPIEAEAKVGKNWAECH